MFTPAAVTMTSLFSALEKRLPSLSISPTSRCGNQPFSALDRSSSLQYPGETFSSAYQKLAVLGQFQLPGPGSTLPMETARLLERVVDATSDAVSVMP